jgi:hypothetical protein
MEEPIPETASPIGSDSSEVPSGIQPQDIIFDRKTFRTYELPISSVIDTTLDTIQFSRRHSRKDSPPRTPTGKGHSKSPGQSPRKLPKTLVLLKKHRSFLDTLSKPLFWFCHLTFFFPELERDIASLTREIGVEWHQFLYPLHTCPGYEQAEIDRFVLCLPYFYTQAIQDLFIRLLEAHPTIMERSFRMQLCRVLVKSFTGIDPVDTLLKSRLGFYFRFPPQSDFPDRRPTVDESEKAVTIPVEDVSTLIEMPHRQRAVPYQWNMAHVSPFMAPAYSRPILPLTQNMSLILELPRNGETDWTTDLPPLILPSQHKIIPITTETYDPRKETRSLMHRSRKPLILTDHAGAKRAFAHHEKERHKKRNQLTAVADKGIDHGIHCRPKVLSNFVTKLRQMQIEKKQGETPEVEDDIPVMGTPLISLAPAPRTSSVDDWSPPGSDDGRGDNDDGDGSSDDSIH